MPKIKPLTTGEAQILQSAGQVFSGMVATGKVNKKSIQVSMDASIQVAIYLYKKIDAVVVSKSKKTEGEGEIDPCHFETMGDVFPWPW